MSGRELSDEFKVIVASVWQQFRCARRSKSGRGIFCGSCCDQTVGIVGNILRNKRIEKKDRRDIEGVYETKPDVRRLILVLESPHKGEFDKEGKSLGPAQRGTSAGIVHNLESIISPVCDGFSGRELILVNAIRVQCSQGLNLRGKGSKLNLEMKNCVFERLLGQKRFLDDFIVRLNNVYRRDCGDIVVNVVGMNSLSSCKVGRLIQNITGQCSCGIGHPSAWWRSKDNAARLISEIFKKKLAMTDL